jgi:NTE family protein
MPRTALVLSGGGMFGAYQAGAWRALAREFEPDLVVGASVGSLNGYLIASGCDPDELIARWLDPRSARLMGRPLEQATREMVARYTPRIELGVALVEIPRFRTRVVRSPDIGWRHLVASCAIPGLFAPVRIDGRWYVDGGLTWALPVGPAIQMGATRIIGINVLPQLPSALLRGLGRGLRFLSRDPAPDTRGVPVSLILPSQGLGSIVDAVIWRRENIERWIDQGEQEAGEFLKITRLQTV